MSDCDDDSDVCVDDNYDEPDDFMEEAEPTETNGCCGESPLDVQFPTLLRDLRTCGWCAAPPPLPACGDDDVSVMIIDTAVKYSQRDRTTLLRIVGRTADGQSAAIFATGWLPHITVEAPRGWRSDMTQAMAAILEEKVRVRLFETAEGERMLDKQHMREIVSHVSEVQRETIMGYVPGRQKSTFLRIHLNSPDAVGPMRDCLHGYTVETLAGQKRTEGGVGIGVNGSSAVLTMGAVQTYDSNVEARLQAMVDLGMRGGQWVSVPGLHGSEVTRTSCDMEFDTAAEHLRLHDPAVVSEVPPLRVVSFDIEVSNCFPIRYTTRPPLVPSFVTPLLRLRMQACGRRGVFPDPQHDKVIMLAMVFDVIGAPPDKIPKPIVLCLRECNPIEGAVVICYTDDQEVCL